MSGPAVRHRGREVVEDQVAVGPADADVVELTLLRLLADVGVTRGIEL